MWWCVYGRLQLVPSLGYWIYSINADYGMRYAETCYCNACLFMVSSGINLDINYKPYHGARLSDNTVEAVGMQ